MKWYSPCHVLVLLLLLLLLCLFLFLPFWFNTQKGEDHLPHAAGRSSSHSLRCHDGCFVFTYHTADPIEFLLALIDPHWCPVSGSAYEANENSALYPPQGQ
jgi:hypothetical protein